MPGPASAACRRQAIIDEFRQSGLTQAEFCSRPGLSLQTFRRRLHGQPHSSHSPSASQPPPVADPTPPARPLLLPLTLVAGSSAVAKPGTSPDTLLLILDAQRRISVAPGFDADTLRRLIEAIESLA